MFKVLLTAISITCRNIPHLGLTAIFVCMLGLLAINALWVPCRGRGRYPNNLRSVTFALVAWTAIATIVSLHTDMAAAIYFAGVIPIGVITWFLNDRRSSHLSIPNLPLSALLVSNDYVQASHFDLQYWILKSMVFPPHFPNKLKTKTFAKSGDTVFVCLYHVSNSTNVKNQSPIFIAEFVHRRRSLLPSRFLYFLICLISLKITGGGACLAGTCENFNHGRSARHVAGTNYCCERNEQAQQTVGRTSAVVLPCTERSYAILEWTAVQFVWAWSESTLTEWEAYLPEKTIGVV